mmetsp:Transcript_30704/g.66457  ORF Transcript_30704/g.66457 Transcript_30704/m.66457 type:complete len:346 (+) Transcript_30704:532-1569(+)
MAPTNTRDEKEEFSDASLSASSAPAAPPIRKDRSVLSQSTPAGVSNSSYPAFLLYKTKKGSIMKYATLDDSMRSAMFNRSNSMPDGDFIHAVGGLGSKSDSAAARGKAIADAAGGGAGGGILKKTNAIEPPATASAKKTERRNISFGNLEIREYARTIGCNPSVSAGPPVGLDWTYDPDHLVLELDEYEESRGPRRSYAEMAMPRAVRQDLLIREWGVKQPVIATAVRDANRIKSSRRRTVHNINTPLEKMEYQIEKAKRNAAMKVRGKKTARQEYEKWKDDVIRQWERWAAERVIEEENAASEAEAAAAVAASKGAGVEISEDDAQPLNLSERGGQPLQSQLTV